MFVHKIISEWNKVGNRNFFTVINKYILCRDENS